MNIHQLLADCGSIGDPCPPPSGDPLYQGIKNLALPDIIGDFHVSSGAKILQLFLTNFLVIGMGGAGIATLFMIIWGGYEYITAGGDKEATQKAAKRITNGLIGLTLTLSIFAIIFVVETIFGISLLKVTIPTIQP